MIINDREVMMKNYKFTTSTVTSSTIIITWDQAWPRVSFPCFYRHPPHTKYTSMMIKLIPGVVSLTTIHIHELPPHEHSRAKRHQRKHSFRIGCQTYTIICETHSYPNTNQMTVDNRTYQCKTNQNIELKKKYVQEQS